MKDNTIYGVGINNATYKTQIKYMQNGKYIYKWTCPFYSCWKHMLERCYSNKCQEKHPTYKSCTVCDEWLYFSNFKSWMETQDWEGRHLDKDLLVYQNKVCSPETCVFISQELNSFLTKSDKSRGNYPLGVNFRVRDNTKPVFVSQINYFTTKRHLGHFKSASEAHLAWQKAKVEVATAILQSETNPNIVQGLNRVISKIENDIANGIETINF